MPVEQLFWLLWQAREHLLGLASAMPDFAPLFQLGGIGCIVAYLLLKTEPRLRGMEAAIDRNTKAQMLFLLAQEHLPAYYKAKAQELLEEIHDAQRERGFRDD